ncbi:MAG TPA: hypothetical protein VF273_06665 [Pelobium sp.]
MKNLTAHYNIYFNAKEALDESKLALRNAHEDDFSQLLDVFPLSTAETAANETENLNQVISRANIIAIEKYESNWLDDSYLLLADAEYLKGDYYNAIEYYSYVSQTFEKEKRNKLKAYLGQAKSDFALGLVNEADSIIKLATALHYKYDKDELAAVQAKLAIEKNNIKQAIEHLKVAVSDSKNAYQKTRWRYILAQLQEIDGDTKAATANYDKIAGSNAAFEIAFNANLSKIRISENAEGKNFDKILTLKKLLKEDKNQQFKDQIYFQIAKTYQEKDDFVKASKNYVTSAHTVPGTAKQKGLSYLKLAEINFNELKNYTKSELYYDSTLQFLPKNYPLYQSIAAKAANLKYLADRLTIIQTERNNLYLASLSDEQIDKRVDSLFTELEKTKIKERAATNEALQPISTNELSASNKPAGTFYFYNTAAIGQGYSEFKRRWGNRKLTDDWRISSGNLNAVADKGLNPNDPDFAAPVVENRDSIKSRLVRSLPYTAVAKEEANTKITNALYEIALFYKDVLKDEQEAAKTFQSIVQNYPDDKNLANIYYQLYRLSAESNPDDSNKFKNKLLSEFPNSVYAKAIKEPNFGKEKEFRLNALKTAYAEVYKLYQNEKYSEVLNQLNVLKPRYSGFKELEPKFAYLQALTVGHTQKTPMFLASLSQIAGNYPDDTEVTPIVKKQMEFISKNRSVFDRRPTALLAHDNSEYNYAQPQMVFNTVEKEPNLTPAPTVTPKAEKPAVAVAPKKADVAPVVEKDKEPSAVVQTMPAKIEPEPKFAEVKAEAKSPEKTTAAEQPTPSPKTEPAKMPEIVKPVIAEKKPDPEPEKPKGIVFSTDGTQRHEIIISLENAKQNIATPFFELSQYFSTKFDPSAVKLFIRVIGGTEKVILINGSNAFYTKRQADQVLEDLKAELPKLNSWKNVKYIPFVISDDNLKLLTDKSALDQYLNTLTPKK